MEKLTWLDAYMYKMMNCQGHTSSIPWITTLTLVIILLQANLCAQESLTYTHNGLQRDYILYLPEDLPAEAPLVFVLHGYTGTAEIAWNGYGMWEEADLHKFAVCYPQGTKDIIGITHWNANLTVSSVDDIGFLTSLAGSLQDEYSLSPTLTFACGMSNGGFMCFTLACEKPDVFHAIASVSGTMSGKDWKNCDPENPVPIMQISGSEDNLIPIDGSLSRLGGWGGAPGLDSVTIKWAQINHCIDRTTTIIDATHPTTATYFTNGINEHAVHQYLISGWGHKWPAMGSSTGISASARIWNFFNKVVQRNSPSTMELYHEQAVQIYPDSTRDIINIEQSCNQELLLRLFAFNGQLLLSDMTERNLISLDMSDMPQGFYVLHVNNERFKLVRNSSTH